MTYTHICIAVKDRIVKKGFTIPLTGSSVLWCPLRFPHKNDVRFVFTSCC